jgi:UDPglucose 6-dehydrogenase
MPPATLSVAIIGTGYVGLVTGACLAALGHRIVCVDTDAARIAAVAHGETPIHEQDLADLLRDGIAARRFAATTDLAQAVAAAQVIVVAVGTPSVDGRIDLSAIETAARQIGPCLRGRRDFPVVAVKSTVVPGTTDTLVRRVLEETSGGRAGDLFGLAMNPEFLSQGSAVRDFVETDRIVIGQWDERSGDALAALYHPFLAPMLRMSLREAELVKYAANGLQATLVSYANQIAALCEAIPGTDQARVLAAVHLDRMLDGPDNGRAGATRFLMGGIGFGGSCFPKDLLALIAHGRRLGIDLPLFEAVNAVNAARPAQVLNLLATTLGGLYGKRIAVLGLAFKPGTDDLRESPALALLRRLDARGADIVAHDPLPLARDHARRAGIAVSDSADDALAGADAAVLATAWPHYRTLDWSRLAAGMRHAVILDGRRALDGIDLPRTLRVLRVGVGGDNDEISAQERA